MRLRRRKPEFVDWIRRFDVNPGDTVVLKLAAVPTVNEGAHIQDQLRAVLPADVKTMLIGPGMDVTIVGRP